MLLMCPLCVCLRSTATGGYLCAGRLPWVCFFLLHDVVLLMFSSRAVNVLVLVDLAYVCYKPGAPGFIVQLVRASLRVEVGLIVHVGLLDEGHFASMFAHVLFSSDCGCLVHAKAPIVHVFETNDLERLTLDDYYGSRCGLEGDHDCFRSFRILESAWCHNTTCTEVCVDPVSRV